MRKDIALARKIDTEHCSRQNLGHRTFGNDLFFLGHCAANITDSAYRSTAALLLGSGRRDDLAIAPRDHELFRRAGVIHEKHCGEAAERYMRGACAPQSNLCHDLAELFQRKGWHIFAKLLTFPPCAGLAKLIPRGESIAIKHRANVARWFVRERVVCEQAIHVTRALE